MSDGTIAIIVVASILGYSIGCGITYAIGNAREWGYGEYDIEHFIAVILWPVVLPGLLAYLAVDGQIKLRDACLEAARRIEEGWTP